MPLGVKKARAQTLALVFLRYSRNGLFRTNSRNRLEAIASADFNPYPSMQEKSESASVWKNMTSPSSYLAGVSKVNILLSLPQKTVAV